MAVTGLGALGLPDEWWRAQWHRFRRLDYVAGAVMVPTEDVRARLLRAGVQLRGRRPQRAPEVTAAEAARLSGPVPVQILFPGVEPVTRTP